MSTLPAGLLPGFRVAPTMPTAPPYTAPAPPQQWAGRRPSAPRSFHQKSARLHNLERCLPMFRSSLARRSRTPLTVVAGASIAAGLLVTAVAPASADKGVHVRSPKPTVVLVHGAFADS